MSKEVFIVDGIRTPIGNFGGSLGPVRTDDLGALVIRELLERNPGVDPMLIEDVLFGCANQAGEDNRNVARMSGLLAGLPWHVGGETVNRLCASGMAFKQSMQLEPLKMALVIFIFLEVFEKHGRVDRG